MADEELYYLQPGFDLSSLTVPRLRSILVAHDTPYPSSAKKQDLITILQQQIVPQSKKLLSAQARIRRTSKGIENVPSSQEDDTDLMPPPPAPKTPRSRKSKTNLQNNDETPRTNRKSRTPSGRKSARKPRESDTETDADRAPQSVRRVRKSAPGTMSPANSKIEGTLYTSERSVVTSDSPFSDENPFQSGSSPPSEPRTVSRSRNSDGKRKSLGKRKDSPVMIKSETYELPVSSLGVDHSGVETTEEFTIDAENELEQELASNKQLARVRNSALRKKKPASAVTRTAPLVVLTAVLAAIGGWYRQEKINIGYCGVGQPQWSLQANPNIPAWAHENLQPQCEPCPSHAICYSDMEAKCEDDFVLQPHPLSLNGLVPLPPTCEPDSDKERRIKAVADRAVEELRERRAAYECGEESVKSADSALDEDLQPLQKLEIPEETLKREVSKMRRKGMSSEEFEDLWRGALGDIINRDEVEVIRDGSSTFLSSKSLARLSFTCAVRRSIIRSISSNRIPIVTLILVFASLGYGRYRLVAYNQAKSQTPSLVAMTLDRLATQAALHEDGRTSESFISVSQLRDDVLRNVFSVRERDRVWQRVRKIVESNSNVRAATREGGKTGEWSRVWEWIGPVNLVPGLEGRKSGLLQASDTPDSESKHTDIRRWDEGRPIY